MVVLVMRFVFGVCLFDLRWVGWFVDLPCCGLDVFSMFLVLLVVWDFVRMGACVVFGAGVLIAWFCCVWY